MTALEMAVPSAYVGASGQDRSIQRFSLENGLDVVLVPDHRAPMVVVDLAYKVGVMNEPAGRSGFAHLFEHLMFAGTPAFPDVDAAYGALGVDLNASTWDDHTLYYARGMASTLPFILSVEADRMANQGGHISQDAFEVQRGVVINEIRQNVIDNVAGAAWEAFPSALFPAEHPYSRSVYGSIPDLEAATLDDARALFGTYYVPNNAILCVVGDFNPDVVRGQIDESFGRVPRGGDVALAETVFVPTRARLSLRDRVPTDMVFVGWSVPSLREDDLSLLRVAAELLGNTEYGLLRRALIDTGLANGAWVHLQQGLLASRFIIQASAADGVAAERIEEVVRETVASFLADTVGERDFRRARTRIFVDDRVANEDQLRFADNVLAFTQAMDDPAIAVLDDAAIAAASAPDIGAAAGRWLQPEDASVAHIRPGKAKGLPSVLGSRSGPRPALHMVSRPSVKMPRFAPGIVPPPRLPSAEATTLANGVRLVHYRLPHAALVQVAAASTAGTLSAPAGKEGIIELATALAVRGAGDLPAADFGMAARDIGAEFESQTETLGAFVSMSVPPENLDQAAAMFADVLRRPRIDADEFAIAKAEVLNELALREADLGDVAARYGEAALFPRRPGQAALDRSVASTEAIGRDDVAAALQRIFAPFATTLYSVGPTEIGVVADALSDGLAGWNDAAEPFAPVVREAVSLAPGRRVLVVPDEAATQVALYVALPAPGTDEPAFPAAAAVYRLLNHDFNSRLNTVLREAMAVTYGTDGGLFEDIRQGSALTLEVPIDRDALGDSLRELFRIVGELSSDPVREEELERTRIAYRTAMAATGQTGQGLFDEVCRRVGRGSSLEEAHRRRLAVANLELDAVREEAAALAALDRVLVVAAGRPDVIVPQLEALGLKPEILERTL